MDTSKFAVVRTCNTPAEAAIFKSILDEVGIESALINENISALFGNMFNGFAAIKVVVNTEDQQAAEEALAARFDQQEFDTESVKRRKKP